MKKIYMFLINLLLYICSISAFSDYYMAPYGSVSFNLNSPEWNTKQEITLEGGGANGPNGEIFESGRTLIVGGIDKLEELVEIWGLGIGNEISRYSFDLKFEGAQFDGTYFWFTKQSDPAFRRPFQIQIGYRVYREGSYSNSPQYFDLGLIEGSGEVTLEAEAPGLAEIIGDLFNSGTYYVSFEFGIILPGEIKNGILASDSEDISSLPIASGYDYSSEIEVTATLIDSFPDWLGGKEYAPISFTIPFSGYYDPRVTTDPDTETSASLFVRPDSRAANIDLLNDQGKTDIPIADVDFSVFGLTDTIYENDDIFMFLSSSSNPFDSTAGEFRFVHKDVGFGEAITESNSIGYKIKAVPNQETVDAAAASETSTDSVFEVTYDGTDYLTADGSKPDATQRMHTACYKETLGTVDGLSGGREVHWHSYSGTLYLELDTNNVIMDEGLYRSTVYVHVVTDENISGGAAV